MKQLSENLLIEEGDINGISNIINRSSTENAMANNKTRRKDEQLNKTTP